MRNIKINLDKNSYDIIIKKNLFDEVPLFIKQVYSGKKVIVVTDKNVQNIYGKMLYENLSQNGFEVYNIVLEPGEKSKSFDTLQYIYTKLIEYKVTRTDLIIAFGGGVVGDIAGFSASTYLRGIPFVQIPTTLLAQVDSSIGGKVAVDLPQGKNLVGSFYNPKIVLIDTKLLKTLPQRFIKDGMAEVIKYACICDNGFFQYLNSLHLNNLQNHFEEIVYTCCDIKKIFVEHDERDKGKRMILNFGHTIGHAIESYFNYETFTHGEAVAKGMYQMTLASERIGITKHDTAQNIKKILEIFGLNCDFPTMDKQKVIDKIKSDKKNLSGIINIIQLKEIGSAFINSIGFNSIEKYL
ncbi:3-dehydroquinate synthase [Sedimentibacter sp. zth1]|uniref:3-dehydroquinate synthase n=1 Tax=Sedimentibacter sp. zth1 TaxID=2816908 RepID=UPI001A92D70B|nr:3-dehydroquinate synthase [Sedimentibacter sp. zth1]QSX06088.1 3-dehydroquinate synthase [Sedimentibacter sp. zth1]